MPPLSSAPGASIDAATLRDLAGAVGAQRTLADLLAWGRAQRPPRTVDAIVTQDEYTHDVVVRWDERAWLAYDTT
jgi:hypothetical protein